MSFYRDTVRTARKEHKCCLCNGTIKVGEKYHDKAGNAGNDDNLIYYGKECELCQPVIKEFFKSGAGEEGYCDDYIQEWWQDEKCPECKKRYYKCEPDQDCSFRIIEENIICSDRTEYGTCSAGDNCTDMTHYRRCENFDPIKNSGV